MVDMDNTLRILNARHKQLVRLLVGGHSQSDIARILQIHKSTVSRLVRDPLIVQEVSRVQDNADMAATACVPGVSAKLAEGALKGVQVLLDILADTRNDAFMLKLKANAATELLGRAGYGETRQVRVQQSSVSAHLTAEDIAALKRRADGLSLEESSKTIDIG
jgi:FixJ family two-component response regulator